MNECTHIGLDVHKDTIAVAVLRPGTTEVDERVIPRAASHPGMLRGRPDRLRHASADHRSRLSLRRDRALAHPTQKRIARELTGFIWGLMTDNLGPAR
jgi:hypothetical protein